MKKSTIHSNSPKLTLFAVFVAGLVVATFAWYYSDRLNIAFGQGADIDVIGIGRDEPGNPQSGCIPYTPPQEFRDLVDCKLVTTTTSCLPVQKYINQIRTRRGRSVYESTRPGAHSIRVTKYETSTKEERTPVATAISDLDKEIEQFKVANPNINIGSSERYLQLSKKLSEIKNLKKQKVGMICPQL